MKNLFSYKGEEPKSLPSRIRLEDGMTRTSLENLSVDELFSYGFVGPFDVPEYDTQSQKLVWDGENYNVINYSQDELDEMEKSKVTSENYIRFWNYLIDLPVYRKIREESSKNLSINTICLEFISNLNDAKNNIINVPSIQNNLNFIFLMIEFSEDQKLQLFNLLNESKLNYFYTIPDETFFQTHTYDPITHTIIKSLTENNPEFAADNTQPYPSWTWNGTKWCPPVHRPSGATKESDYSWDEENQIWIKN